MATLEKRSWNFANGSIPYYPWTYFFIFLIANTFLAYSNFSIIFKLWVFFMGLTVPFYAAYKTSPSGTPNNFFESSEPGNLINGWLLLLFFLGAFLLHLYLLRGFTVWPIWDEGYDAFFPLKLSEEWRWELVYGGEPGPPGTIWIQGFFFKIFHPSLSSLWLFASFSSVLCLPFCYAAACRYFNPSLAFLYTALASLNFWPLFLALIPETSFDLFWQFVILSGLAAFIFKRGKNTDFSSSFGLGLGMGLGWIFSKFWVVSLLFLFPSSLWAVGNSHPGQKSKIPLLTFCVGFLISILPIFLLGWKGCLGNHLSATLFPIHPQGSALDQWRTSLSYLTSLFWGQADQSYFTFGPYWGGFFNPLLTSAFFLGLAKMLRWGKTTLFFSAFLIVAVLGLPLLSNTLELVRIFPLFPFLVLPMVIGWASLLSKINPGQRGILTMGFLVLSLTLDLFHLAVPYFSWAIPGQNSLGVKFVEPYRASQILKMTADRLGPGLIYQNFLPDDYDRTLLLATYPFNAGRNPRLSADQAQWAGLITKSDYGSYLTSRFPGTHLYLLPSSTKNPDAFHGPLLLAVIPIQKADRPLFEQWEKAQTFFDGFFETFPFHSYESLRGPLATLARNEGLAREDPFLQSVWIWKALFLNQHTMDPQLASDLVKLSDPRLHSQTFWNPIRGQVFQQLGDGLIGKREYSKAQWAFEESAKWDPKLKLPPEILRRLDLLEKQKNILQK